MRRAMVRAVEDNGMSYDETAVVGGGRRSPILGKIAGLLRSIVMGMPAATVWV
jgi:hypothetical protein